MIAPVASAAPCPAGAARPRRADIQVLRGVAVLAVLLFHAGLLPAGYLGVDLFFALSGFLMTRIIAAGIEAGDFRLGAFYARRAARLLPAALVTLAVTTALAPFLLTPTAYSAFRADLFGALTFSANIVLWLQTDYFAAAAETKPLLHTWSLAVEEQFYLIWPLALMLLPRRVWPAAVVAGIAASLALATALGEGLVNMPMSQKRMEAAAFFLLPSRAFELLIGAGAALALGRWGPLALPRPLAMLLGGGILALLFVPLGGPHPGLAALAICLLTALACVSPGAIAPPRLALRPLARIGDWSYSIYLVHWPLIAYANAAFLGETPLWVRVSLIAAAVPLGALQWRLVEEPLRHGWRFRPGLWGVRLAGATVGCAVFGAAVIAPLERSYPQRPAPNVGLARVCDQRGARFVDLEACRTRTRPRVALLGDSYAMQWANALAADEARFGGLVQITKSGCAPTVTLAPPDGAAPPDARECAAFMTDAAARIGASAHIEVVVLSSSWSRSMRAAGAAAEPEAEGDDAQHIAHTIAGVVDTLKLAGKRVLLLAPAPSTGRDVASCNARAQGGVPLLAAAAECTISLSDASRRDGPVHSALLNVAEASEIPVLWPAEGLCRGDLCRTKLGEVTLYADRSHLTVDGALTVARSLQLAERLAPADTGLSSPKGR